MLTPFECFVLLLIWFHSSEFVLAAFFNYSILTWNCEMRCVDTCQRSSSPCTGCPSHHVAFFPIAAWLFSKPYVAAMAIAGLEYGLEVRYLPWMKARQLTVAGLWLACVGEVLRKAGMLTAQRNFTHKIQFHRRHGHTLVKHGIYRYERSVRQAHAPCRLSAGCSCTAMHGAAKRRCVTLTRVLPCIAAGVGTPVTWAGAYGLLPRRWCCATLCALSCSLSW